MKDDSRAIWSDLQPMCQKVEHLTDCMFVPVDWSIFAVVLPPERHIIDKAYTATIEGNNSNTRRSKVVPKRKNTR